MELCYKFNFSWRGKEGRAREMVCETLFETLCEHPKMRSPKEAMCP